MPDNQRSNVVSTPSPIAPRLLTVPEVARLLRLKPKTIYALVAARRMPCVRMGRAVRLLESDVVRWIHENRVASLEI
jgi:excisionase family DNA binding protein